MDDDDPEELEQPRASDDVEEVEEDPQKFYWDFLQFEDMVRAMRFQHDLVDDTLTTVEDRIDRLKNALPEAQDPERRLRAAAESGVDKVSLLRVPGQSHVWVTVGDSRIVPIAPTRARVLEALVNAPAADDGFCSGLTVLEIVAEVQRLEQSESPPTKTAVSTSVSRLRADFRRLGLNPYLIETVKGKIRFLMRQPPRS